MPAAALADLTTEQLEQLDHSLTRKLAAIGDLRWHRDLTEAERRVDFVKLAEKFDTAEAEIAAAVAPVLGKQRARLLDQARTVVTRARGNKGETLAADIAGLGAGYIGAYQAALTGPADKLYAYGKQTVRRELAGSKKAAEDNSGLSPRLKQLAEQMARRAAGRLTDRITERLFNALVDLVGGDSWDALDEDALINQLTDDLRQFAPKIAKDQAAVLTGRAINTGRVDAAQEFEVETAAWSAILDTKTCPLCEYLDGMRISIANPDYQIYTPGGLHPHDRCIWIFLTTDDPDSGSFTWVTPPLELVLAHAPNLEWAGHIDLEEAA